MSETVAVRAARPYAVRIGPGCLAEVRDALPDGARAVLTDGRVAALHAAKLAGFGDAPWIQVPRGEDAKTFAELERVLGEMARAGLDRGACLVTLGGGAVCDLGGLAASLYMRGIDVVHCPTTLLAQVDAAVGGKTAVNLPAGKNLAGTFHQPRAVFADTEVLATLEERELRSGMGEVCKCALLGAEGLAARLDAGELDRAPLVAACVRLKAAVVADDEREAGARKQLNLGHTFAHAIEHAAGYGAVPHGVAVAVGLSLALETSRRLERLEDADLPERAAGWLRAAGLPATLAELRAEGAALDPGELAAAMARDKKGRAAEPRFVLPLALGRVALDVAVPDSLLADLLR